MSQLVAQAESADQLRYASLLVQIESLKQQASDLRANLESLNLSLNKFQAEYHLRLGPLFVQTDRIRLAISEYEQRIEALQTDPAADPNHIEDSIHRDFSSQRQTIDDEETSNRQYEHEAEEERRRPTLSADDQELAKRLYRDLARRFHPDLARSDAERQRRQNVMQQINACFRDRDIDALRRISKESAYEDQSFEFRNIAWKLQWATAEIARLEDVVCVLRSDIDKSNTRDTYQLWMRSNSGEPVIENVHAQLRTKLDHDRDLLSALISTYRELLESVRS